jgi:hypothetical protein
MHAFLEFLHRRFAEDAPISCFRLSVSNNSRTAEHIFMKFDNGEFY